MIYLLFLTLDTALDVLFSLCSCSVLRVRFGRLLVCMVFGRAFLGFLLLLCFRAFSFSSRFLLDCLTFLCVEYLSFRKSGCFGSPLWLSSLPPVCYFQDLTVSWLSFAPTVLILPGFDGLFSPGLRTRELCACCPSDVFSSTRSQDV